MVYEIGMAKKSTQADGTDDNFYAFRGQWLDHLVERQDLTHGDFRVAYFIASKINPTDNCMWWGVRTISEEMGVSVGTVTAATSRLSKAGLLVVAKGRNGSYRYSIRLPIDPRAALFYAVRDKRGKTGGRKRSVSKTETSRVSKNEN